jgi:hypothetical protein
MPPPEVVSELVISLPKIKPVEETVGSFDPMSDFNDWARAVRSLDSHYLERDAFLKQIHGKQIRWRGVVTNAGDDHSDADLVLRAMPQVDDFYNVFHVWLPKELRAKVSTLHDGDYVEATGKYAGEVGLLQQPRIYGDTVELISGAARKPRD